MGRKDLLAVVEAAYELDCSNRDWLKGLAESVQANVPFRTLGVVVNAYDVSDPGRLDLARDGIQWAAPDERRLERAFAELRKAFESDPDRTRASYGALDEGLALDIPSAGREQLAAVFDRLHMGDVYGINGRNPSRKGCLIGIYLPRDFAPITSGTRRMFARIARHVAAAYRLRARLADRQSVEPASADAVLTPAGKVEHAAGAARSHGALEELRRSVMALASARSRHRFEDPERAISAWKALVDARWSLVDHFERDGSHYLLAHRNDCQTAPMAVLTLRERQVAALAAMGYSNKGIAYDLGIATSTVGVLVSRAMARLGLRSRRELRHLYGVTPSSTPLTR